LGCGRSKSAAFLQQFSAWKVNLGGMPPAFEQYSRDLLGERRKIDLRRFLDFRVKNGGKNQ